MATINDIIMLSANGLNISDIINKLIKDDGDSDEKKDMVTSQKYYEGNNDIEKVDFRKYVANGVERVNKNRSNHRISHNFLKIIVNQIVSYIAGNSITYKHEDPKFQEYLDEIFMFDFDDNNINWIKESRIKGAGYIHFYKDKIDGGQINYTIIPSEQCIPIYKDGFKKDIAEFIRYYHMFGIDSKGDTVLRKKVEWWNATDTKIYIEDDLGDFNLSESSPHWITSISTRPDEVIPHSWGKVPFVELLANDDKTSDLQDIKGSNDAYDLIQSEFVNQIADVREILVKVLGYSGASADEIMTAFRGTGIVKIDDATGDIDVLKTDIPVEARNSALKNLKENIYMLGQSIDPSPEKLGTSISGIALKMLYGPLDMKANIAIRKLRKALYQFMWFIVEDYNMNNNASINYRDVKFTFNKNMIINEAEIVESLQKSVGVISNESIREKHPYADDPILEEERMAKQDEKDLYNFNNAMADNSNNEEV